MSIRRVLPNPWAVLLASLVVACGAPPETPDAGEGTPDAGEAVDAGGTPDAGEKTLVSLALSPATPSIEAGATVTLTVRGTYSDDSEADITSGLAWQSDDDTVATVDGSGVVTGVKAGSTTITARIQGKSGTSTVTVTRGSTYPVFTDDYAGGIIFRDFGGATNAISVDTAEKHAGAASLKVLVPASGYTGGAAKAGAPADLTGYDALTFWAKASKAAALNVAGFANDSDVTTYQVERNAIALTTTWTKYVIPVPDTARLTAENGLFHFAEGAEDAAYTIWFDDVKFETLGAAITNPRPAIATETITKEIGGTHDVNGASVIFAVDGSDVPLSLTRRWFTWASSNTDAVTVDNAGRATAVAAGSSVITAKLGTLDAAGATTINVTAANAPPTAAPTPTYAAGDVSSLFSDPYTNIAVSSWSTEWDNADVSDETIAGNATKKYSNLNFAGIEFAQDASEFTHFRLDVWTANASFFKVKLVNFLDGNYNPATNTEYELTFDATSTPVLASGQWVTLDIPLASFTGVPVRTHLRQLILSSNASTVFVDNVLFHK